ncbi:MAG: PAS domain S-box protein [Candidatus Zixiibacteriota bacterium]|nr:MAG: PAS domain S-box protein [candidate division Zixibacteria bacterium]
MRLLPRKKPGFLTRLGNIIIIQVIFVFAALALVIFYPDQNHTVDSESMAMRGEFQRVGEQITQTLNSDPSVTDSMPSDQAVRQHLREILRVEKITRCYLYSQQEGGGITRFMTLERKAPREDTGGEEIDFDRLVNPEIVKHQSSLGEGTLTPIIHDSRYFVYYYQFRPDNDSRMVLVAISDHGKGSSVFGQVKYTFFVLFLASTLLSLLTVYLINKRFQEPLERLIAGFEKTVKGELYSLVETDMDDELSKLATAYNDMSLTLWENHKRLSDYNARLEDANEMLAESQEFLGTLIDSSPSCIISASPDGEIMLFNRKAADVFRVSRPEIIGHTIDELFTHKLSEIETCKTAVGDNHSLEILCRRGDGSLFPAYLISAPVHTKEGRVWAQLYLVKDISESKKFQEMMIRLDRYYTRGEMAGDIAHEINNFLAILSGNIELMPLLMQKNDLEKIQQKLEVMKGTVDKITQFTDGLMDSSEDTVRFEMADMNQLVETVVAFLKPQNRFDGIEVQTVLSTEIPLVEIDSAQVQQLLVNLLYNASEALEDRPNSRLITIKTRIIEEQPVRKIILKVSDTGPGVQLDKEELLFRKRFTTKPRGHGIGLMTCKRIIDTHDGRISYENVNGAVFTAEFPLLKRAPKAETEPATTPETQALPI